MTGAGESRQADREIPGPRTATGMPSRVGRWGPFAGLASLVVLADQLSKAWVDVSFGLVSGPQGGEAPVAPTPVLGDVVRIAKVYNDGGIFGLLGESALLLGLASMVVIAGIVWYQARHGASRGPILTLALGLLLGGAVGNLIDRLRFGYVIDWVDAGVGSLRWYTFNVADSAISVSLVLLLALGLLADRTRSGQDVAHRKSHVGGS